MATFRGYAYDYTDDIVVRQRAILASLAGAGLALVALVIGIIVILIARAM